MIQIENCFYCEKATITVGSAHNKRYCGDCDVFFYYIKNKIQSIQMSRSLSGNPNKMTTIYIFPNISQIDLFIGGNLALTLKQLEDITPVNAQEWITKKLKLVAFA